MSAAERSTTRRWWIGGGLTTLGLAAAGLYSVSPRFEFTDTTSMYARVATGFRPGGPNVLPPGPLPPGTPTTYDSDELTSYELGLRTGNASGTFALDVAAFYLDWEDIQLLSVINGFGLNANGGTAVSEGFELTATAIPVEGLTFSFNAAYANAELTEYFDRFDVPGTDSLLVVISELVDTENLLTPYWTSQQFKRENDTTGWNPTPCAAR